MSSYDVVIHTLDIKELENGGIAFEWRGKNPFSETLSKDEATRRKINSVFAMAYGKARVDKALASVRKDERRIKEKFTGLEYAYILKAATHFDLGCFYSC